MLRQPAPLVVMSFNRPHYLEQVLHSLLGQRQDIRQRQIFLYQDGAQSALTGRVYAAQDDIIASIAIFSRLIPWGKIRYSVPNLGVAQNFRRAESDLFSEPEHEIVYFFEDDLVLSPHYLDVLDRMAEVTERSPISVGYFAAYGHLKAGLEEQQKHRLSMRRLAYHWAFGLRRDHWLRMQPLLQEYYHLLEGKDYGQRNHAEIKSHFQSKGVLPNVSSQDDVKKAITYGLGAIALNTHAVYARYIGEKGVHMTPKHYAEAGFADTQWLEGADLTFELPSTQQMEKWRDTEVANRERNRQTVSG